MTKRRIGKLNYLERNLLPGFVVDARWLEELGYSSSLRSQYVSGGWLEQPAPRVYRLPSSRPLTWQHVVVSLQAVLNWELVVGGRTALELQGFAHYLNRDQKEVHLYGPKTPPTWLEKLPLEVTFHYHNSLRLFPKRSEAEGLTSANWDRKTGRLTSTADSNPDVTVIDLGGPDAWPLAVSTPERAFLELLDELPTNESFHQADMFMEGLVNLRPRRLQQLLTSCKSVKVKRLFFFLADRHGHRWLKQLNKSAVDLGEGKRHLVQGGKLDRTYQITVPQELHGVP